MKILKFGGTSVASAEVIEKVIAIVQGQEEKVVVVVSAMGGITNTLLEAASIAKNGDASYLEKLELVHKRHQDAVQALLHETDQITKVMQQIAPLFERLEQLFQGIYLIHECSPKTKDKVASFGELLSSTIIAAAMQAKGLDAVWANSQDWIVTDDQYTHAKVDSTQTNRNIQGYFKTNTNAVVLVPGFVAKSSLGETTTLGRGGSDYTAAILAAALEASILEIWTDVSGMYTAHPAIVKQAKPIAHISYEEAMELSHFGAKVLYPPTIQPILDKGIPMYIKNTFAPEAMGTLIDNTAQKQNNAIQGISHISGITLATLEGSGMVGIPGISKRFFEALYLEQINIILITQASSEHSICIAIQEADEQKACAAIAKAFALEITKNEIQPLQIEKGLSIIAVVGDQMKSHQGISGKMFRSLGKNNVNIRAIAQGASEKNISAVIEKKDVKKALNILHNRFFSNNTKQINLFVAGIGNVGAKLLEQIAQQQAHFLSEYTIEIRLIGVSNSKKMLLDADGISYQNYKERLGAEGIPVTIPDFIAGVKALNLRNSIFVDNTASPTISDSYIEYLKESIAVVTCNKIACSSPYPNYKALKDTAKQFNAPFLFETNVGAGLPIIDTLKNLVLSGDKIHKIQAVLSGSLNFVFNNYDGKTSFHDVVVAAGEAGYTEPDPRIDLTGVDVMRKILILARESGAMLEMDAIENRSFLPKNSEDASSVSDFYSLLQKEEAHFKTLFTTAKEKDAKLKYVATFDQGKATVGLEHIPSNHPFYNIEGSDNIVLFYSKRYPENPLLIKGAGAGAAVTASGLFADIIRIANY